MNVFSRHTELIVIDKETNFVSPVNGIFILRDGLFFAVAVNLLILPLLLLLRRLVEEILLLIFIVVICITAGSLAPLLPLVRLISASIMAHAL